MAINVSQVPSATGVEINGGTLAFGVQPPGASVTGRATMDDAVRTKESGVHEVDKLLKAPEKAEDTIQVYTLVLKGKPPSVHKAFPTRTVSLSALRYCRQRVTAEPVIAVETKAD